MSNFGIKGLDLDAFVRATLAEDLGEHGDITWSRFMLELGEYRPSSNGDGYAWEASFSYGGDIDRPVLVIAPRSGDDGERRRCARRMVAVKAAGQWFVAPDNGLLSAVTRNHPVDGVWEISNPKLYRRTVSATFHGRDIMAPAAAHLALGLDPNELGPARHGIVTLSEIEPREDERGFVGEVERQQA